MALKQMLAFALRVVGDGSDRTVSAVIGTAPFGIGVPTPASGTVSAPPLFSLSAPLPTAVINVVSSLGKTISAGAISLGVVTFTYGTGEALDDGQIDIIYGDFVF